MGSIYDRHETFSLVSAYHRAFSALSITSAI